MENLTKKEEQIFLQEQEFLSVRVHRRSFLRYAGAGVLIRDAAYLTLAGKIVSVEARHAALIRDLISNGSFASSEVIDSNGLDKSRLPLEVLGIAAPFIKTKINANDLPKS